MRAAVRDYERVKLYPSGTNYYWLIMFLYLSFLCSSHAYNVYFVVHFF